MSLDPCGKAIPVAVYTKDVLTTAGCLKWSASFKNYPSGLQNPGNVLEVTVFDPNNQEVSQGSSDSLSGDPQSGGSFAGTVSIPEVRGTAPVGLPAAGTAGAPAPQNGQESAQKAALDQQAADFQSVSAEYTKRALDQAKLPAKSSIRGSAFFPVSAGEITEVVVSVRESHRSENVKDLAIALPNKQGAPAETASGGVKVAQ